MTDGVDGLRRDRRRPSRIPPLPKAVVETVVTRTLEEAPPDGATHWTAPAMAAAGGLSVSSVQRIWRAHGLRPHQIWTFKLSPDPNFATKVEDIVGLYVDPPAHAVVLSIDEKSHVWKGDPCDPPQLRRPKAPKVLAWPARHPRWVFHFTPTSCSWLNAVETVFAKLAKRRLKRGVFPCLNVAASGPQFVEAPNRDPKPFVWKADPNAIIAAAE